MQTHHTCKLSVWHKKDIKQQNPLNIIQCIFYQGVKSTGCLNS